MKNLTSFNGWISSKLTAYLTAKEGCAVEDMHYTIDGVKTTVSDAFGYIYEIEVKTIGRKNQAPKSDIEQKLFDIKYGSI